MTHNVYVLHSQKHEGQFFPLAAGFSLGRQWCVRATTQRGENTRLGSWSLKTGVHRGFAVSNSRTALGLRTWSVENCSGEYSCARYYSPEIGRFASEDPLRFTAGTNFYKYVDNKPTNMTDPSGEAGIPGVCPSQSLPNGGFIYYGNWGGPGWTGSTKPYEDMTPEEQSHLAPPIDAQDACYQQHDICYSRARVKNKCTTKDKPNFWDDLKLESDTASCDIQLAKCLLHVPLNGHSGCSLILFPSMYVLKKSDAAVENGIAPQNPPPYQPYHGWGSVDNK